jgi:DNA-binding transcriptional regulator GbsR (MarR family)
MLTPLQQAKNLLVRRWGEMGGYWGISRTMAEIHALLFVTREPLCTDDIMDQLKISRGNASMNLRALVDWGLIERVHKLGDRKEYFQADTDVWHMFETIMRERRRREVEPIIATIDRCCETVEKAPLPTDHPEAEDRHEFRRRIEELRRFLATMGRLFELALQFGDEGLQKLSKVLSPPPKALRDKPAKGTTKGQ